MARYCVHHFRSCAEDLLGQLPLEVLERAQTIKIPLKGDEVARLSKSHGDWICKVDPLDGSLDLGVHLSVDVDCETTASGRPVTREERLRQQLVSLVGHVRSWSKG